MDYYTENYLSHHGILGMKWGHRKRTHASSGSTEKMSTGKKVAKTTGVLARHAVGTGLRLAGANVLSQSVYAIRGAAKNGGIHVNGYTNGVADAGTAIKNSFPVFHKVGASALSNMQTDSSNNFSNAVSQIASDPKVLEGAALLGMVGLGVGQAVGAYKTVKTIRNIAKS